jgi:hypothetical protein
MLVFKQVSRFFKASSSIYNLARFYYSLTLANIYIPRGASNVLPTVRYVLGNCDIDFLTFAIAKFKTSKFQICSNKTEILQSSFKSTESKTESQQSTLQLNESKVLYH